MSVDQPDVVDFVTVDDVTGAVVLSISDHLPWHGIDEHLLKLQAKLNHYLAYCLDGQLHRDHPELAECRVEIRHVHKFSPDEAGKGFLAKGTAALEAEGIIFRSQMLSVPH
jgi:hypothetical protein